MMVAANWVRDWGEMRGETPTRTPRLTSGPWLLTGTIEQSDLASHNRGRDPAPTSVISHEQIIEVAPTAWAQDPSGTIEVVVEP